MLDLNGHVIDRGLTEATADGYVIEVEGDLTIADGSADKAGVINGSTDEGGNIILDPQGGATRAQIAAMVQRFCEKNKK